MAQDLWALAVQSPPPATVLDLFEGKALSAIIGVATFLASVRVTAVKVDALGTRVDGKADTALMDEKFGRVADSLERIEQSIMRFDTRLDLYGRALGRFVKSADDEAQ
jgi:hypothetical protein